MIRKEMACSNPRSRATKPIYEAEENLCFHLGLDELPKILDISDDLTRHSPSELLSLCQFSFGKEVTEIDASRTFLVSTAFSLEFDWGHLFERNRDK